MRQGPRAGAESLAQSQKQHRGAARGCPAVDVEHPGRTPDRRVRPARPPCRQGRPQPRRTRRAALRGHRAHAGGDPRGPVGPARRRAQSPWREGPGRDGPRPGDPPPDRPAAHPAPLRARPVPRTHRQRRRPGARLRRTARPDGQHGPSAARRLALPRRRAVLRGHPCQPHGAGEPAEVPLDPRPGDRLLGRGLHPRGFRRSRGLARRPVRLHRQPRQHPVGPDARRPRHHPGRPGRHHPRGLARGTGRRRRTRHGEDGRGPAPHGIPAVFGPAPRASARWRAVRRPARALPGVCRGRAAQPR